MMIPGEVELSLAILTSETAFVPDQNPAGAFVAITTGVRPVPMTVIVNRSFAELSVVTFVPHLIAWNVRVMVLVEAAVIATAGTG